MKVYFAIADVAEALHVDERPVRGWIKSGELRAVNCGSKASGKKPRWRISEDALEAFLAARSATPEPKPVRRRRRQADTPVIEYF
jgi:excisionase family DNA binding protein